METVSLLTGFIKLKVWLPGALMTSNMCYSSQYGLHGKVLEITVKMTHTMKMKSMLSSDTLVSDVEEAG